MPRRLPRLFFIHERSVRYRSGLLSSLSSLIAREPSPDSAALRFSLDRDQFCRSCERRDDLRIVFTKHRISSFLMRTRVNADLRSSHHVLNSILCSRHKFSVSSRIATPKHRADEQNVRDPKTRVGGIAASPSPPLPRIRFIRNVSA